MKPGSWEKHGIPEHGCRVRTAAFEDMIARGGTYDADELIRGLMDWLDVTDAPAPAVDTLRMMIDRHYPPDGRKQATCRFVDENGVDRSFIVGGVDPALELVTWQRDNLVFALGQASASERGRIVVAAPLPLPLSAALRILGIGMERFMDAPFDSFAGAVTMSGSTGNFYAWERGELTTSHWPHGLGRRVEKGCVVDCSDELHPLPTGSWLPPCQVAMLVAIAAGYLGW
jgi:hypothetical protein